MPDNQNFNSNIYKKRLKTNYKKKISAKLKKIKLFFYYNSYERPVSYFTLWQFIKIAGFILVVILIFYKFFLPK